MEKKEVTVQQLRCNVQDVSYPCDYCGGRTLKRESYTAEVIGLHFNLPTEGIKMKCCMWCWKKVFDIVLGGKQSEEIQDPPPT